MRWLLILLWVITMLLTTACGGQSAINPPGVDGLIDSIAADVLADDTLPADTAAVDAISADAPIDTTSVETCPGGFECPCVGNEVCNSGYCLETDDGNVCTKTCDTRCPVGYTCIGVSQQTDVVFICVPDEFEQCAPCETSEDCAGTTAWCVTIGDGSKRCAVPCTSPDDCPVGFACGHVGDDEEGATLGHCIPVTGSCPCMDTTLDEVRSCEVSNAYGACAGNESCTQEGWDGCDAATPTEEVCDGEDNDCDGEVDEGYPETDTDGDGQKDCEDDDDDADGDLDAVDCAPTDPAISSSAQEVCDGVDNDCDNEVDEGFPDADGDGVPDCFDADDDGDGDPDALDCAPFDPTISHNAAEFCDGVDNNCDGSIDEGFADTDGDKEADCVDDDDDDDLDPDLTDCAPTDPAIHAQAEEICDGVDNNCSVGIDEGFVDTDDDGFADCVDDDDDEDGDPDVTDCAPTNSAIHAAAAEICDGVDNNCDGSIDEGFIDTDGDQQADCVDPDDDNDGDPDLTDCQPLDDAISSQAKEICDGVDNNCGGVDEGFPDTDGDQQADCVDLDDDNDGDPDVTDCAPLDADVSSNSIEICDGVDNNCGGIDEGFDDTDNDQIADCVDEDDDNDGEPDDTDCAPLDPTVSPLESEQCDAIDHNCNGDAYDGLLGSGVACPAVDCANIKAEAPNALDGVYQVTGKTEQVHAVHCVMDPKFSGGGWTLVAVSSDDGVDTWTWDNRNFFDTNNGSSLGNLAALDKDFKSTAYHLLSANAVLFIHSTPKNLQNPIWAAYELDNGGVDLGSFLATFDETINYKGKSGISLSGGTLTLTGTMCSTDLFINPCGLDGGSNCTNDDNTHGPAWSSNGDGTGCPLNDPATDGGLGPKNTSPKNEYGDDKSPSVGFGKPLGLNSGNKGSSSDYMWILVR